MGLNQAPLWPRQLCVGKSFVAGTKCHHGGVPSKGPRIFVVALYLIRFDVWVDDL